MSKMREAEAEASNCTALDKVAVMKLYFLFKCTCHWNAITIVVIL